MDQDFFEEGQYQQPTPQQQQPDNAQQDQDQEGEDVWGEAEQQNPIENINTAHTLGTQNASSSHVSYEGSNHNLEVDDEITRKIQQEEQQIQEKLRDKANKEYEEKQARKQEGKRIIEEFFEKKEKEKQERKQQNLAHEKELIEKNKQLNSTPGWKKVAVNVNLKQGEYKGSKSINRMREAIINKREDEKKAEGS